MTNLRTPRAAVTALFLLAGGVFGVWASRIPAIAERHDLEPGPLGALLLLIAGGGILSFPLAGLASDRIGAKRVARVMAWGFALMLVVVGFAPNVTLLAIALLAFGMSGGSMDVAMNAWGAEVEKRGRRPMMSSFHAMFSLGAGAGAATGYFAANWGIGPLEHFALTALPFAALGAWWSAIDWTSDPASEERPGKLLAIPRGGLLAVGLLCFCATLGEGAMTDWSAVYLIRIAEADEAWAALGFTAFSAAMVAARLAGDRIVAHFGAERTARVASIIAVAGLLLTIGIGSYWASMTGFVLMGLGYAILFPLAISRASNEPSMSAGSAIAAVATLGYGGLLLGPPVIGFVAHVTSIRVAFGILLGLAILSVFLARSLKEKT